MKIGPILVDKPIALAPMEDVTDQAFRLVCKRLGADLLYTEFVNAEGLVRESQKTRKKMLFREEERPFGIQIYGADEPAMEKAAQIAESFGPDLIDINCGCWVKDVGMRGAGAGLLRDLPRMARIAKKGNKEFNAKSWAKARVHFRRVLALTPHEAQVRKLLESSELELSAQEAIEEARQHLAALDYQSARLAAGKVKSGSRYQAEADALRRKIDDTQAAKLVGAARNLQAAGDISGALEKVKEAQAISPTSVGVRDLLAALNEAANKRGGPRAGMSSRPPAAHATKTLERPRPVIKERPKPPKRPLKQEQR